MLGLGRWVLRVLCSASPLPSMVSQGMTIPGVFSTSLPLSLDAAWLGSVADHFSFEYRSFVISKCGTLIKENCSTIKTGFIGLACLVSQEGNPTAQGKERSLWNGSPDTQRNINTHQWLFCCPS